MALFQDAHINMPFQSWEIRPHKTNAALLTIIAAISEIEIEIKVIIIIISISKEDDICSMTANLSYGSPMNTDINYYQTFLYFFYLLVSFTNKRSK